MVQKVSIGIKRNFEGVKFGPSGPSNDERESILKNIEVITDKFNKSDLDFFSGNFYQLGKIGINEKKTLGNMSLSINDNTTINDENFLRAAQLNKEWPNGRALYVSNDKSLVMKINYIDHLEMLIDQNKVMYVEEIEVMKPPPNKPDEKPVKTIERKYTYDYCNIF
jgi:protein-arginine kinase